VFRLGRKQDIETKSSARDWLLVMRQSEAAPQHDDPCTLDAAPRIDDV
jgi:hypothetical protein